MGLIPHLVLVFLLLFFFLCFERFFSQYCIFPIGSLVCFVNGGLFYQVTRTAQEFFCWHLKFELLESKRFFEAVAKWR